MAHKNRISLRPTPQVYAPPPVFQRQVASPQVYIPPNSSDVRFAYPPGALPDYQTYGGTSFWSRSSSYYKCPPFIRSPRDFRNIPGVSRVSYKNSPLESVDSVDYYCEICKVNCVGKQSYTAHLAGQKHKKKSKQQEQQHKTDGTGHEVEESISCSCDTSHVTCHNHMVFDGHLAGHKHQRKAQLIINDEKAKYPCKICGILCTGKVSYDAHLLGSKHQKNVESAAYIKRLGCAACGVECNSQVSYEEHITGQKHKRNVRQQYADKSCVCKVCRTDCKTKAAYDSHIAWKKHCRNKALLENLKQSAEERREEDRGSQIPEEAEGKTKELQCPLCNIKCSGVDTYRAHLSGKQHQRAVKLQTTRGFAVPDCETVLVGANQKNWIPSSHVDLEDCIEEVLVGKVMHFRCRLCECTFSDSKAKNVHENGKKHQTALRRFKAASSLPFSSASRSTPSAQNDEESSGSCGVTVSTQRPLSPRGPVPTSSISSVSSSPSTSFLVGRPHFPPMGSGFVRPPGPCVPSSGLQALVSLPPHALADERYMQTKLRCIAPSEEENELMTLAIDSVSNALRRILRARGDDADISNSNSDAGNMDASEPTGVFIVGPAAVGLLLGGQRTADMVLVSHELPSTDCVAEVAEELEELLKESCKNHTVTVATVEGTYVLVQMTSKFTSSADNPTATDIMATVRLRLTSTRILDTKAETALKQPKSGANDHYHEGRTTAATAFASSGSGSGSGSGGTHDDDDEHSQFSKALLCLSPRVCRDALTDMRRALWLQGAMAAHPAKTVLQNVARLMRCLIRDSQPLSWGRFPDYVLMVLLERLSYMDLAPPDTYQGAPPRLRMGLLFRRLLECLSTGALISRDGELANLPDPAGTNGALILDDMRQADRLAVTSTAQMALRLVAFRQIYKLLDVPKFVPPCLSQCLPKNGVAAKRRATGDCGFGGSPVHGHNYASASVAGATVNDAKAVKYHQQNRDEGVNTDM